MEYCAKESTPGKILPDLPAVWALYGKGKNQSSGPSRHSKWGQRRDLQPRAHANTGWALRPALGQGKGRAWIPGFSG